MTEMRGGTAMLWAVYCMRRQLEETALADALDATLHDLEARYGKAAAQRYLFASLAIRLYTAAGGRVRGRVLPVTAYATSDPRCPLVVLVTSGAAAGLPADERREVALNVTCRQITRALKGASVLQAKDTKEQGHG